MGDSAHQGDDQSALRHALLSISYHTVGQRFEINGAPSVLLPPAIRPMSLERALSVISELAKDRLDQAIWRIMQCVPVGTSPDKSAWARYPSALLKYMSRNDISQLDNLRQDYRRGSYLFVAGLTALRDPTFYSEALLPWLKRAPVAQAAVPKVSPSFNDALRGILNTSDIAFLQELFTGEAIFQPMEQGRRTFRPSEQVTRLESEIGLSIQQLTGNLADIMSFSVGRGFAWSPSAIQVYPVSTIVSQDTRSLATTATVTTIVRGHFSDLVRGIEPANWQDFTDIIEESVFVDGPLTLNAQEGLTGFTFSDGVVTANPEPLLLREKVQIGWENTPDQQSHYDNVLNISARADGDEAADVRYSLCRSIDSSFLWDRGPGGLVLDSGFVKLRRLGNGDAYRLTMRKSVQFGDRAGSRGGSQSISALTNYLAPAALAAWLEGQIYGIKRMSNTSPA